VFLVYLSYVGADGQTAEQIAARAAAVSPSAAPLRITTNVKHSTYTTRIQRIYLQQITDTFMSTAPVPIGKDAQTQEQIALHAAAVSPSAAPLRL